MLATGQLAEDLWVSSLYYEALKDRPLQLVLAQLREGDIQQQLEQCELPQQFEGREFSAMAYHGLKDAKAVARRRLAALPHAPRGGRDARVRGRGRAHHPLLREVAMVRVQVGSIAPDRRLAS